VKGLGKLALILLVLSFSVVGFAKTRVAITVDDLPAHGDDAPNFSRSKMFHLFLKAFKKHHLPPVYGFVNGVGLSEYPNKNMKLLKKWVASGNLLGNHTFGHLDLNKKTPQEFIDDVVKNEGILEYLQPTKNFKFFRYPFLNEGESVAKHDDVRNLLAQRGYQVAEVTVDFQDWLWNDPFLRCLSKNDSRSIKEREDSYVDSSLHGLESARKLAKILFGRDISHILLVHIGAMDAKAIDEMLTAYEREGVEFVTLEEAIGG